MNTNKKKRKETRWKSISTVSSAASATCRRVENIESFDLHLSFFFYLLPSFLPSERKRTRKRVKERKKEGGGRHGVGAISDALQATAAVSVRPSKSTLPINQSRARARVCISKREWVCLCGRVSVSVCERTRVGRSRFLIPFLHRQ